MDSFDHIQRQLRFSILALGIIFPIGVLGYMAFESLSFIDAIWITIITLGTIGYGDLVPVTNAGRVFTIFLIVGGIGAVALGAQAAIEFLVSPYIRTVRIRRRAEKKIAQLQNHYIVCGEGELVNRTINYLQKRAELRLENQRQAIAAPVDAHLARWFGDSPSGTVKRLRDWTRNMILSFRYRTHNVQTMLDILVVITQDEDYVMELSNRGLLAIHDDPTDDRSLRRANIVHARALMVMLENDAEALLTVLTARSRSSSLYITAATVADTISAKIIRVGANNVLTPSDIAGQFLNNTTLRPAVNAYFYSILFEQKASEQIVQLYLSERSQWIGQTLGNLQLRERFKAGVIGLRMADGRFFYAPGDDYVFQEGDIVMAVTPGYLIPRLQQDCCAGASSIPDAPNWQRLPQRHVIRTSESKFSLLDAEKSIQGMSSHYIICGSGPVLRAALDRLSPERPFVVLSDDQTLITEIQHRGFRVIHGDITEDSTLRLAGVDRALAIMIAVEDRGKSVLTTLSCRALNRELLIVSTADTDDMIPRLRRAGADRVVTALRIAAQFVLLATTRPVVSDFMQYVLYNYEAGVETTELYMQDNSPWIGKAIDELELGDSYRAFIIGIRLHDETFEYAPPGQRVLQMGEVLIVITPMEHADTLRLIAHGGESRRPRTLRSANK